MRVLISADMEGVTGVTCPADVEAGTPQWDYHRIFFTGDVNAAVRGFFDAGADEVLINDAHSDKRNLLLDQLDDRATMLIGKHKKLGMMEGIDTGVDAIAYVGYHSGAGTQGVLAHTYLGNTITGVWLNGALASEGHLNYWLAAECRVPLVLVTGDDLTIADAAGYAPAAQGVAVKICVDRYSAICLPPTRTAKLIQAAAAASLRNIGNVPIVQGPHEIVVEFDATHPVAASTAIPSVERAGDRRVRFELPTMVEAMRCFKAVTTLASASIEKDYG